MGSVPLRLREPSRVSPDSPRAGGPVPHLTSAKAVLPKAGSPKRPCPVCLVLWVPSQRARPVRSCSPCPGRSACWMVTETPRMRADTGYFVRARHGRWGVRPLSLSLRLAETGRQAEVGCALTGRCWPGGWKGGSLCGWAGPLLGSLRLLLSWEGSWQSATEFWPLGTCGYRGDGLASWPSCCRSRAMVLPAPRKQRWLPGHT